MTTWPRESYRTIASLVVLCVLLTWESFAPFFAEYLRPTGKRARHALCNLSLGALNVALNGGICVGLWWAAARWAETHRFGLLHWMTLPTWAHWLGVFIWVDLWMYGWHRMNHRVGFLWRFHR